MDSSSLDEALSRSWYENRDFDEPKHSRSRVIFLKIPKQHEWKVKRGLISWLTSIKTPKSRFWRKIEKKVQEKLKTRCLRGITLAPAIPAGIDCRSGLDTRHYGATVLGNTTHKIIILILTKTFVDRQRRTEYVLRHQRRLAVDMWSS